MFRREDVKFRSHTVLKADMLSLSCKAPMEYLELQYSGWADGVLCGAQIIVGDNELTVQPGIILYQGNLFRMTESTQIPYEANGRNMKLQLHFGECRETEAGKFYEADLSITEETERRAGDMELVRFCLQEGAKLRDQFKNFEDIGTQFNTLNYIHAECAGYKEPALSLVVLSEYVKEASKCAGTDAVDFAFFMECYRGQNVSRASVRLYLQQKLQKRIEQDAKNQDLYEGLKQVLRLIRTSGRSASQTPGRRIMID